MEVLEIDGKKYVKSRDAASKTGYTTDYIGQLCRSKEVDARLVGRSWYVTLESLSGHRTEKKRSSRLKAREQVKKEIQARKASTDDRKSRPVSTAYQSDERELMPVPMKHPAPVSKEEAPQVPEVRESDEEEVARPVPITQGSRYAHKQHVASVPKYAPDAVEESKTVQRKQEVRKSDRKENRRGISLVSGMVWGLVSLVVIFIVLSVTFTLHLERTDTGVNVRSAYTVDPLSLINTFKNIDISSFRE